MSAAAIIIVITPRTRPKSNEEFASDIGLAVAAALNAALGDSEPEPEETPACSKPDDRL